MIACAVNSGGGGKVRPSRTSTSMVSWTWFLSSLVSGISAPSRHLPLCSPKLRVYPLCMDDTNGARGSGPGEDRLEGGGGVAQVGEDDVGPGRAQGVAVVAATGDRDDPGA